MKLSAWYTVKNEEEFIKHSINSIKNHVDEIVVVDTGSTDKTLEILKQISGIQVYSFDADYHNLSDAMNFAVSKCIGDYLLRIDGDEIYYRDSITKIGDYIHSLQDLSLEVVWLPILDMIDVDKCFIREEPWQIRIIRKDLSVYEGAVWQLNTDTKTYSHQDKIDAPFCHYKMLRYDEQGMMDYDRYVRRHTAVNKQRYNMNEEQALLDAKLSYYKFIHERECKPRKTIKIPEVMIGEYYKLEGGVS